MKKKFGIAGTLILVITVLFVYFYNPVPVKTQQVVVAVAPYVEEQVEVLQELNKLRQQANTFNASLTALKAVDDTMSAAIETNKDSITHLRDTDKINESMISENAGAIRKNGISISAIAENVKLLTKTSTDILANAEAIATNTKTLRDHESRITNAQRSANRALGVALMMATGMSQNEAKTQVNAFVVGDLKLGRLAVLAQKVPKGIKRAQATADTANTTARTGLELLRKHGSKGWFSIIHDQKLVKAAEEALTK